MQKVVVGAIRTKDEVFVSIVRPDFVDMMDYGAKRQSASQNSLNDSNMVELAHTINLMTSISRGYIAIPVCSLEGCIQVAMHTQSSPMHPAEFAAASWLCGLTASFNRAVHS